MSSPNEAVQLDATGKSSARRRVWIAATLGLASAAVISVAGLNYMRQNERAAAQLTTVEPTLPAGPPVPAPDWVRFTALTFPDPATGQTSVSLRYQNTRPATAKFDADDWIAVKQIYFAKIIDTACKVSRTVRSGAFTALDQMCFGAGQILAENSNAPSRDSLCATTPSALAEVEASRDALRDISNPDYFAVGVSASTIQAVNAAVCTNDVDRLVESTEIVMRFAVVKGMLDRPEARTVEGRTDLAGTADAIWAENRLTLLTDAIEARARARGLMQ